MSETDWRRVPTVVTDKFYVLASPETVQLVFGHEVAKGDIAYHTGLIMSRANAEALCQLINDLISKASSGTRREGTGGKVVH